jgi:hypothetical protein
VEPSARKNDSNMKTDEVNDSIIGKRCKSIFTGLMVTGIIEAINITRHTAEVKVRFDEPHRWGKETYGYDWSSARLHDGFGSLEYLEIIDAGYEAVRVTFGKPIREIDRMFACDYQHWQTVNLKEWIDGYESSRFTRIDERTAIITSEYNMDCLKEWLSTYVSITAIETVI